MPFADKEKNRLYQREYSRKRRAAAVQDFLEERYRLPRESLEIRGMGEAKPLDPSDPESGVNRRVEIINLGSGSSAP